MTTKQLEQMPRLERMEYHVNQLKAFAEIVKDPKEMSEAPEVVEIEMVKGTGVGYGIFQNESINVSRWFISANSEFPNHIHEEREEIIVYEGCLMLTCDGEHYIIGKGETFIVNPNAVHSAEVTTDTKFITVTVPCPKCGFPRPE